MHGHGVPKPTSWHGALAGPWPLAFSALHRSIPWQRWEWLVAVGLFVLAVSTRWPLRVSSLEELDSANYALAVREFNIETRQPHPPGYLFFVGATRLAHLWLPDPIQALTSVQVVSGALSLMLFYGLLRLCMPPAWALGSTLLVMFNAQVWFQHVRPLEDAYAFLWMLGVVYALVRSLSGDPRWWIAGMVGLGLAMGAKQLLPAFLVGLVVRTLWDQVRRRRLYTILLGVLGGGLAVLTWFIPLSLHVGTARAYVAEALSQLAYLRQQEALVYHLIPSRIASQLQATFVLIWGPTGLALPMWSFVALGTWRVLTREVSLRWLLWLVIPTVLVRFFFLGYSPRFGLYYLPFLMSLAVVGFHMLLHASVGVIRRLKPCLLQNACTAVLYPAPWWFVMPGIVLLAGWAAIQTRYIVPTLSLLHSEPSPVFQAVQLIRRHYEPTMSVLLTDNDVIWRQLDYYAAGAGIVRLWEPHLNRGNLDILKGVHHVLKLQAEPFPPTSGVHLGTWALQVVPWRDLFPFDDFLQASLYELRGPIPIFNGWYGKEFESSRIVRWSKPEGSQIRLVRVPSQGCSIRLQGVNPTPANWASRAPVTIKINGESVYTGQDERIDAPLQVHPTDIMENQVVIDVLPGCAFIPAQVEKSSGDQRHLGCFRLTDLLIQF